MLFLYNYSPVLFLNAQYTGAILTFNIEMLKLLLMYAYNFMNALGGRHTDRKATDKRNFERPVACWPKAGAHMV